MEQLESLEDPVPTVAAILARCHKAKIMVFYKLADFKDLDEFLVLVAKRFFNYLKEYLMCISFI